MANFGFTDLVVVKPWAPVWRETLSAVGAERLILEARAVNSLEEATGDCHLVLGTTTLRGRSLERPVVCLPKVGSLIRKGQKVAILFGSEKTGLPNKYLDQCHAYLTIPTHKKTPSMNLSHAVSVCCYELSQGGTPFGTTSSKTSLASVKDLNQVVHHGEEVFQAVGYLSFLTPAERSQKIRRTLLHWRLAAVDVKLLHGLFRFLLKKLRTDVP
jgi:TrmH family RNA methyltransferase